MVKDCGFQKFSHMVNKMHHIHNPSKAHPMIVLDSSFIASIYGKGETETRFSCVTKVSQLASPLVLGLMP